MTKLKQWALSGVVISLAATGLAFAQQTPETPASGAPSATSGSTPMAGEDGRMSEPGMMEDDAALDDGNDDAGNDDADVAGDRDEQDDGDMQSSGENGNEARGRGRMGRMDADRSGSIERNEFQGRRIDRLKAADSDGDGTLSAVEMEAMVMRQMAERRAGRMMRRLDVDGDGKVTIGEVERMRDKRFAIVDLNDDGKIDRQELREIHRGVGNDGERGRQGRGGGEMRHGRDGGYEDRRHGERYGRHGERYGRHGGEGGRHGSGEEMMMPGGDRDNY